MKKPTTHVVATGIIVLAYIAFVFVISIQLDTITDQLGKLQPSIYATNGRAQWKPIEPIPDTSNFNKMYSDFYYIDAGRVVMKLRSLNEGKPGKVVEIRRSDDVLLGYVVMFEDGTSVLMESFDHRYWQDSKSSN